MSLEDGIEYEVYWTKCETDEESPDAYIPGLTQNKFKPWQFGEMKANPEKSKNSQKKRMTSEEEDLSTRGKDRPSLKDLCPEDKTRIANLIRELAKTGREKDNAANELKSERKKYQLQEQHSKEQLKLLAKERDTVKQHYIKCQQLLAQYQKELKEEQMKAAEAVQKAVEQEKASQAAQELADQKARSAQVSEESKRKMAQEKAWAAEMAAENERKMAEQKAAWAAQRAEEKEKLATDYAAHNSALQRRLDSNQSLRKPSQQGQNMHHSSVGLPQGIHPDFPIEGQFYPAMTSTNRSQHTEGQIYPAMTRSNRSQHILPQNIQTKELRHQSHPSNFKDQHDNHWSINEVADPRRSAEEFHALEAQIDDTPPTLNDEFTPMSPVQRQDFNDNAPQYRQSYIRMTPEQRWNELLLHREKLCEEQDWLRRKLQEQEELLQQRKKEKTNVTQDHLMPVHLLMKQNEEAEWQVPSSRPTHHHQDFDNVSSSGRVMQDIGNRQSWEQNSDKMNSHPQRVSGQSDQQDDRAMYSEPMHNRSTTGLKGKESENRGHLIAQQDNHVRRLEERHHTSPTKLSVIMSDKGCSPLHVDRQTLLKQNSEEIKVPSERRFLDTSRSGKDHATTRYMENTSFLKDIVDTVEATRFSRYDSPQDTLPSVRHPPSSVKQHPSIQRDPPQVQHGILSSLDPSRKTFPLSDPPIQRYPPPVCRGIPVVPSRNTFPSPDLFDIPCDEEIDKIEESQILQDIFFLN